MEIASPDPFIRLVGELLRVNKRIPEIFVSVEEITNLSRMQITVLASVAESRSAPTVAQLGKDLGHPRQVIQRVANDLIDAGLLKTEDNPRHKRARVLVVTRRGAQVRRQADQEAERIAGELMKFIDADSLLRALGGIKAVRFAMDTLLAHRPTKPD